MVDNDSKLIQEAYEKAHKQILQQEGSQNIQNDQDIINFFDMCCTDYLEAGIIDDANEPGLNSSCIRGALKVIQLLKNTTGADFSKYKPRV